MDAITGDNSKELQLGHVIDFGSVSNLTYGEFYRQKALPTLPATPCTLDCSDISSATESFDALSLNSDAFSCNSDIAYQLNENPDLCAVACKDNSVSKHSGTLTSDDHFSDSKNTALSIRPVANTSKIWILTDKGDRNTQVSAEKVLRALLERIPGEAEIVYEDDLMMKMDSEKGLSIFVRGEYKAPPKLVITRMHSGYMNVDFQVTLLFHLEMMGVIVVNSAQAVMRSIHKVLHLQVLAKHNIPISTTLTYSTKDLSMINSKLISSEIEYPLVMKGVNGNRGNKVFLLPSANMLTEISGVLQHDVPYLFQKYVKESHGRDLRVIVVDKYPVFSILRKSVTESVKANLSQGGCGEVVTGVHPEAEALAVRIAAVLEMDIAGVDLLFSDTYGYVCCEVNNNPGFGSDIHKGNQIEDRVAELLLRKLATSDIL